MRRWQPTMANLLSHGHTKSLRHTMTRAARKSTCKPIKLKPCFACDGAMVWHLDQPCLNLNTTRCAIHQYLALARHFHFAVVVHFSIFIVSLSFRVFVFRLFFPFSSFLCQIEFMLNSAHVRQFCAILPRHHCHLYLYYVRYSEWHWCVCALALCIRYIYGYNCVASVHPFTWFNAITKSVGCRLPCQLLFWPRLAVIDLQFGDLSAFAMKFGIEMSCMCIIDFFCYFCPCTCIG